MSKPSRASRLHFVLLFALLKTAHPFASWLVDTSSACWRELKAGEIIMNSPVVGEDKSKYPSIQLEAFYHNAKVIPESDTGVYTPFPPSVGPFDLTLSIFAAEVPLGDFQFVVETSEGGTFGDGSGCDGRRASGRRRDDVVVLTLDGKTEMVNVTAAWAIGHEAVTLTNKLQFRKRDDSWTVENPEDDGDDDDNDVDDNDQDDGAEAEENIDDQDDNDVSTDSEEKDDNVIESEHGNDLKEKDDGDDYDDENGEGAATTEGADTTKGAEFLEERRVLLKKLAMNKMAGMKEQTIHSQHLDEVRKSQIGMGEQRHYNKHTKNEGKTVMERFQKKYDRDDFGSSSFSSRNYAYGCVYMFLLILVAYLLTKRSSHGRKGYHDL